MRPWGSNPEPSESKSDALPIELDLIFRFNLVKCYTIFDFITKYIIKFTTSPLSGPQGMDTLNPRVVSPETLCISA